jgi:hypothetical protein
MIRQQKPREASTVLALCEHRTLVALGFRMCGVNASTIGGIPYKKNNIGYRALEGVCA